MRLALAALAVASVTAFLVASRADGAQTSWRSFLAPNGVCKSASDPGAAPVVQARALACLVNWARSQNRRHRLVLRSALRRAAALKGKDVAACGQFTHTPCGASVTSAVRAAGYRFSTFGENLYAGTWGGVSARDVVTAWLASPPHRANVLDPSFEDIGAAAIRAPGLFGGDEVVWAATFGARAKG